MHLAAPGDTRQRQGYPYERDLRFSHPSPVSVRLLIGLIVSIAVWIKGMIRMRSLRKEIASLKSLYTRMQIETKGHMTRRTRSRP